MYTNFVQYINNENQLYTSMITYSLQWRSEGGQGGAAAPGHRPEGGAKILSKNF